MKCTRNWEHDGKFSKSMDNAKQHDSNETKSDEQSQGTTSGESRTGPDKETCPNGASDSDHLHMTALQFSIETRCIMTNSSPIGSFFLRVDDLLTEIVQSNVILTTLERMKCSGDVGFLWLVDLFGGDDIVPWPVGRKSTFSIG